MSARALFDSLTAAGSGLRVDGDRLRVSAPVGALTSDMREGLATYKLELLTLLAERAAVANEIVLSLEAEGYFAFTAGVLDGETIVVVADDAPADLYIRQEWRSAVRYKASEMAALVGADPHSVRIIHELKKLQGATVTSREMPEAEESAQTAQAG